MSDPIKLTYDYLDVPPGAIKLTVQTTDFDLIDIGEIIEVQETIVVSESIQNQPSQYTINVEETVSISDEETLKIHNEKINIDENITLSDSAIVESGNSIDIYETITVSDTDTLSINRIDVEESIFISDTIDVSGIPLPKQIPLDIRILRQNFKAIPCYISMVQGEKIPTDIRILQVSTATIGLDVRVLKYDFSEVSQHPITQNNVVFKINNVDMGVLNDVDLSSVSITHNIENEKSTATFKLYRRFDALNQTLSGTTSTITGQNNVVIQINGITEFTGKIANIKPQSENEDVIVTAIGERPSDKRNSVTIPFSSVGENIHIYDCLMTNIDIDNPYIDPEDENPEYYKGISIDRGERRTQNVSRYTAMYSVLDDINEGTFQTVPNWAYFWFVGWKIMLKGDFGSFEAFTTSSYIGTSLSPISSDVIELTHASHATQRVYDDTVINLSPYRIGEAPYMEVSARNGVFITKDRWEDRSGGLYTVQDEHYNYDPYVARVARIEYEKLKNINGEILPIVSCDLTMTIDAYYFYNIKLLKRLNFSNTTEENIYNASNGFPVSVKAITINLSNMSVSLQASNRWSTVELDEFEEQKPDEDSYIVDERARLTYFKYNVANGERVF